MARPQNIDRNKVLDAAEAIVLRRGAAELTIDAIARAAGITKGGVQSCFGTKDGLINAMVERWCREFEAEITALAGPAAEPLRVVGSYVEATAKLGRVTHARAAGMLALLLQSPAQMDIVRKWYHDHLRRLDLSTPEGRRTRLAFITMEGAFMLRTFGFMEMSESGWKELFAEIFELLPATARAPQPPASGNPTPPQPPTGGKHTPSQPATGKSNPTPPQPATGKSNPTSPQPPASGNPAQPQPAAGKTHPTV